MQDIKLEMSKRKIKLKFLGIHQYFFKDESSKAIDEERLVNDIKEINASMIVMVICYSQILHLRFLLEGAGILAEVRLNREICLQSKGQIFTLSKTQKEFLQTLSQPENIEKKLGSTKLDQKYFEVLSKQLRTVGKSLCGVIMRRSKSKNMETTNEF